MPFCVCLQETHLKPGENFDLRGYISTRKDVTPTLRARGGVAIFIKSSIPFQVVAVKTKLQMVAVQTLFPNKCTICNIYLPDFSWSIQDLRDAVKQLPTPLLLVGDFNAHNSLWGSSHTDIRGGFIEEFVEELDFIILNNGEGTYINSRSNTLSAIDLALCSPLLAPSLRWQCLDDQHSDHLPISIEFAGRPMSLACNRRWQTEKADWQKYEGYMRNLTLPSSDVNEATNFITETITRAAESSVPRSSGQNQTRCVPWWNNEIASAVADKKRAFNIFKRTPTQENLIKFKQLRARSRRLILAEKKRSWEEYVSTITRDTPTPEIWKKVRRIKGKEFTPPSQVLVQDDRTVTSDKEIVEILAKHFEETSSSENYNLEFIRVKDNSEIPLDFSEETLSDYNRPFTITEFEAALNQSKNTAPGNDNIPYELIRRLPLNAQNTVLALYNKIWLEGEYPKLWKEAVIIPISKPGKDSSKPGSYRPVSLTCCLSKVLEKMVAARLMWYLESNNLISPAQAGFRKHRSTIDQLTRLETAIQESFAERNHLVAVFFDIQKAFDMTWRYNILRTIHEWGLRGNLPQFIQSFLRNRVFRVRKGTTFSEVHDLENGIPQGSTISVVLFIIAINKLVESIPEHVGKTLYVDDLAIFFSSPCMDTIEETLQAAIDSLVHQANNVGFQFSVEKTQCIHFCRLRSDHQDPVLNMYNRQIMCKDAIKFLGLTLDKKLYWDAHIKDLVVRCKRALDPIRALSSINWGCDREILLRLYKSFVLSKMDYGCTIYGAARPTKLAKLDSIHGTAIRIALGAFRTSPYASLYCEAGIPPLKYRREQLIANYGVSIWSQPNHPNHNSFFKNIAESPFAHRSTITRPTGVRFQELLDKLDTALPSVYETTLWEIPPWSFTSPKIHLECMSFDKRAASQAMIHNALESIFDKYPGHHAIYTDGSKNMQGVGSAITYGKDSYYWSLPLLASVYTAEQYAIWQALLFIGTLETGHYLILSDSLSSLQAINDFQTRDPLVHRNLAQITWLQQNGKTVVFVWIPSHVGIEGNQLADKMAKEASGNGVDDNIPIRAEDVKNTLKQTILDCWQTEWNHTVAKLREVKPMVHPWLDVQKLRSLNRREQSVVTRLRIGHTNATSLHLLRGNRQPNCEACNTRLTVEHILVECPRYEPFRSEHNIPRTLRAILGSTDSTIHRVIQYLKDAELFLMI